MDVSDASPSTTLARLADLDARWLCAVRDHRSAALETIMRAITRLADGSSHVLYCAVCATFCGKSRPDLALAMAAGTLCAFGAAMVLKRVCRRPRPDQAVAGFRAVTANPDAFSFPSGHTATAFGSAAAVLVVAPELGALLAAFAVLVGCSRVVLGAHYPFDVVAGAVLGASVGATMGALCAPLGA